ncbi:hypothetical protein BIU88_12615 [Chlorobaculum limnaeum]|uniref:DUF4810 domain-containing protein n=1 Tax=Chlorobaculum limnaeum TaxID=274537 RepID=A0A1D8D607_CHLLM|nr:DUF4810 domain-containing protein [Chlorobaculum limnaeum]AOS84897.1 hypothetical protein BIU88_12615 [Chlorobaculum limnaeum]
MKKIVPFFLILAIQGCASSNPPMYEWGRYEDLLYQGYAHPDKLSPEEHIAKLQADYEVAKSKNRPLPPGYHAQLGVLYYKVGKPEEAKKSFISEEELFPESKQYMTRIIDKIK